MFAPNRLEDIEAILGRPPATVADVGCHHGHTTINYLQRFPGCRVSAFEADRQNFALARAALQPYERRVSLHFAAVSERTGMAHLHVNTHDATHSLLPIGDVRYWAGPVKAAMVESVPTIRLDDVIDGPLDLLHMDIQGGEMKALHGASRLLAEHAIALIYCEVEFYKLYQDQPLFWDIGHHLSRLGYHFYRLYDPHYHHANPSVLSWADALFVSNTLLQLPESLE